MRRFWLDGLAALLALAAALSSLRAEDMRAAVPLRPQQKAVFNEIAKQLGQDRSFALVIGISEFDRLPRLKGVQPEADLIATTFATQGFQVERAGADGRLSKSELKTRIADFLNKRGSRADNRLIIYVATHGYAASDRRDLGFLAASDTVRPGSADFEASAYSVRELSAALTGIAAQHVYLFFNACFSGAMLPDPVRGEEKPSVTKPSSLKALSPEVAAWTLELLAHNARLVLTAGSDSQTVPDVNNPYSRAIADGLAGEADADGDGLVLGSELAPFVRGRVARETRLKGKANDAVFAVLPKLVAPAEPRADAPSKVDYSLQGDFVFLSPKGPRDLATEGRDELAEILAARAKRLPAGQFVECADCPVMVKMPGEKIALGRTEVTFAEWDACYREFGCRRFLPDEGDGRGDHPAAGMTWQDALEFSLWLDSKKKGLCKSYRLPNKAEWLSAASVSADAVGVVAEEGRASCRGCGAGRDEGAALPVATLPADPLGTHDISGNLWEWVDDGPACGFADLRENNICSGEGTVMGGSFATAAASLTRDLEGHLPRTSDEWPFSWPTVGLRVACDMK
jgi:hypothetical protein